MRTVTMLLLAGLFLAAPAQAEVGVPAKGGYPEYLFVETVPSDEAPATAQMIAQAIFTGRMVIFAQMGKLTDPELGDKGFTGEVFVRQWQAAVEDLMVEATPNQERVMEKVFWAGQQAIDNVQDRLNVKGIAWKHFLPARWEREMGDILNARTGILTKQPARKYRNPSNAPDALEREVLVRFTQTGFDGDAHGSFERMAEQRVYRYMEPIRMIPPCMGCHGHPKGEPDMLGFEKDGLDVDDVIGLMSVTIGVSD